MPKSKVKLFSFPLRNAGLCKIWSEFCQKDKINVKSGKLNKNVIDLSALTLFIVYICIYKMICPG